MVRHATHGEKHNVLIKAATLCGGYISAGKMEEEEVVPEMEDYSSDEGGAPDDSDDDSEGSNWEVTGDRDCGGKKRTREPEECVVGSGVRSGGRCAGERVWWAKMRKAGCVGACGTRSTT